MNKQYKDLTKQEKMDLFEAWLDGKIIQYTFHLADVNWKDISNPVWLDEIYYRIKELSKPSIDWSHVHSDYKYLARDRNDEVWVFSTEPRLNHDLWCIPTPPSTLAVRISGLLRSFTPGECDWKDSLVQRPTVVKDCTFTKGEETCGIST